MLTKVFERSSSSVRRRFSRLLSSCAMLARTRFINSAASIDDASPPVAQGRAAEIVSNIWSLRATKELAVSLRNGPTYGTGMYRANVKSQLGRRTLGTRLLTAEVTAGRNGMSWTRPVDASSSLTEWSPHELWRPKAAEERMSRAI